MTRRVLCLGLLAALIGAAGTARSHSLLTPSVTSDLSFRQHPGALLPLQAPFRDSSGAPVRLGDFFHGEPVVLVLEYLRCRSLCGLVLQDAAAALARVALIPGKDYEVIAISIDPRDGPADARAARAMYLAHLPVVRAAGWHFLTGSPAPIQAVASAVGFPFRYDAALDQYAHAAGLTVATPQGTISRYVLGLGYRPLDMRLALTEASLGRIASPVSDLLLLCYCYDPETGRYGIAISNVTRALCALTLVALGVLLVRLRRASRS